MKTVITAVALAIALSSTAVMARDGNGSGTGIRSQPFSGDLSKATPQEQQSAYYIAQEKLAKIRAAEAAKAQK